jgi:hypothetical protein
MCELVHLWLIEFWLSPDDDDRLSGPGESKELIKLSGWKEWSRRVEREAEAEENPR